MSSASSFFLVGFFLFCVQLPLFCHSAVTPMPPNVKNVSCPAVHAFCLVPHERNQCKDEEHCLDGKKCCQGVCVRQCLSLERDPETCPTVSTTCTGAVQDQCKADYHCTNGKKCCQAGKCGKKCLVPNKARPGTCPAVSKLCLDHSFKNECERDDQCLQTKKCCVQVCGKVCVAPLQEKAKSCPVDTTECPNILKKDCKNDADCPGTQKCCFSKCILTCVDPR